MSPTALPPLPYEDFPLRPHRNGQWYKSVWNSRTKKSEQFYFGSWKNDPKGERALQDPQIGWLARKDGIRTGIDNIHVAPAAGELTLGELMNRFLNHKRGVVQNGELAKVTLGDYLREIPAFVAFMRPGTPAGGLKPEHFSAYMTHLAEGRRLGRHARKRVRAYVTAFLRYGAKNGWITLPNTGTDWAAPSTDPDALRQAKARAGILDRSDRILNGEEVETLLTRASPSFRAMILLGINVGLGPADIGRLRWDMLDLQTGRLVFPRPKTGAMRVGYLWRRTREALERVRTLKHNSIALEKEGERSLVFLTRKGLPFYRESEVHRTVRCGDQEVRKLAGVAVHNAVSITFGRVARELGIDGVSFYRLRHTFKTLGKRARDREVLDLMMGHKDMSTGRVYDHEDVDWRRVKRVARTVRRSLWPKVKPKEETSRRKSLVPVDDVPA